MNKEHTWKIVPISDNQMLDVNQEDLIDEGHFRLCQTYKGGGGYDQFPQIATERGLVSHPDEANRQFIAQLYGCNLDCPYCYVTREGVWGEFVTYTTSQIVQAWENARETHGVNVFHLMGGAPALQLKFWPELLDGLGTDVIFHSDLMLSEQPYTQKVLENINRPNVLLAVNIKGTNKENWKSNTRKPYNKKLLETNLQLLKKYLSKERWYLTFTNITQRERYRFIGKYDLYDYRSYTIALIDYEAMPYVDSVEWGGKK